MSGATSEPFPVCSGVTQGSILGPAQFLLYVNDLPDAVEESNIAMFADDTKISGAPNDGFLLNTLKTFYRLSRVLLDL